MFENDHMSYCLMASVTRIYTKIQISIFPNVLYCRCLSSQSSGWKQTDWKCQWRYVVRRKSLTYLWVSPTLFFLTPTSWGNFWNLLKSLHCCSPLSVSLATAPVILIFTIFHAPVQCFLSEVVVLVWKCLNEDSWSISQIYRYFLPGFFYFLCVVYSRRA